MPVQLLSESTRMTYRIERSTDARGVTFSLSGEMDSDHVTELGTLLAAESNRLVCLDLTDVTLVNREAMKFLADVEAAGAVLVNAPDYVRRWIDAERRGA
jgi:ABC-type transporter Mla MlaB component